MSRNSINQNLAVQSSLRRTIRLPRTSLTWRPFVSVRSPTFRDRCTPKELPTSWSGRALSLLDELIRSNYSKRSKNRRSEESRQLHQRCLFVIMLSSHVVVKSLIACAAESRMNVKANFAPAKGPAHFVVFKKKPSMNR